MSFALGLVAVCVMNGFPGFPVKIEGDIVINLKTYMTIAVKNKKKTETVEMTFPKKMCKVKEGKNAKPISK